MIRKIEHKELKKIYKEHINYDFPPHERASYYVMKRAMKKGLQEGYMYHNKEEDLGYAFQFISKHTILISLFAILNGKRIQGIGSQFLKELIEQSNNKTIIVEVERPQDLKTEEEKNIAKKRIRFYEKLGFTLYHDIAYVIYGTPYYIMVHQKEEHISKEEIIKQIREIYRATMNKRFQFMIDKILQIN